MEELSQLDLAFCVDLTTSMSGFIRAAQQQMVGILDSLASGGQADLRVAVVGYRDHSEYQPATEVYPFADDLRGTQGVLKELVASSPKDNIDAAEAVFAGLVECLKLDWRRHAYRALILVGDAPPHACGANAQPFPDRWPHADPTGLDLDSVGARLEESAITLFSLSMSPSVIPVHDEVLLETFHRMAHSTGGIHRDASNPVAAIELFEGLSRRVFGSLAEDKALWEHFFQNPHRVHACTEELAVELGLSRAQVARARTSLSMRSIQLPGAKDRT